MKKDPGVVNHRGLGISLLDRGSRGIRSVSRISAISGGFLLLLATGVILVDLTARLLFSSSIGGADELGSYALAVSSGWAFAHTLLLQAHIRIESFAQLLPMKGRKIIDFVGLLLFGLFFMFLTYRAFGVVYSSYRFDARSQTTFAIPLIYPQLMWLAGLVFTCVSFIVMLAELIAAAFVSKEIEK